MLSGYKDEKTSQAELLEAYQKKLPNKSYSQFNLSLKLNDFAKYLEEKLEKALGDDSLANSKISKKHLLFYPNQTLSPLQKLTFLKYNNQNASLQRGYCLGLSLLLIKEILLKQDPEAFYRSVRFFINCPREEFQNYEDLLWEFYFNAQFAQFSAYYTKYRPEGVLGQSDSKEILSYLCSTPINYSKGEIFKKYQRDAFEKLLNNLDAQHAMRVTVLPNLTRILEVPLGGKLKEFHAMTLYADEEKNIYLYNSNYPDEFKKFPLATHYAIYDELLAVGCPAFDLPKSFVMRLNYDIFTTDNEEKANPHHLNRKLCGFKIW